jgi:hypothetical protein
MYQVIKNLSEALVVALVAVQYMIYRQSLSKGDWERA